MCVISDNLGMDVASWLISYIICSRHWWSWCWKNVRPKLRPFWSKLGQKWGFLPLCQLWLILFFWYYTCWLQAIISIVRFIIRCTSHISMLFEAISFLFKSYGRALLVTRLLWNSKKEKCSKNEEENFELLNRAISKNKSCINGILTSWDARKCMVWWKKTENYRENRE